MLIKDQINSDFLEAYKAKRDEDVSILRMLKSAIRNAEIELKSDLDDQATIKILFKELKQREQSFAEFTKANRTDLADKEHFEINFIKKYLPVQMSDDKIRDIVIAAILETGASSLADLGKVMPVAIAKASGQADGGAISRIVREQLQK
jgi:uncharacterized protein YqeY